MTEKSSQRAPDYFINTAPEMDALERAAADGKHGRHYENGPYGLVHVIPGAAHYVRLNLTPEEEATGLTSDFLQSIVNEQDADAALAFLYIARLLAPPLANLPQDYTGAWIDLDDVINRIGWTPRNTLDRLEKRRRVYQFILFGARAQVMGSRRGTYKDKQTGDVINTVIESALWYVHQKEWPDQQSLFPVGDIPLRVEIVISRDWAKLLTSPQTAQFLPLGEILGAIPGSKASGAWARVIGLALASFWRRLPRESLDASIKPTRRELLERYPPKTGPVEELLNSTNPGFAIDYWCGALANLAEAGFIEPTHEAAISPRDMRKRFPRKGWGEIWLDERVHITPGSAMREAMNERVKALPPPIVPARKKGRPKKRPNVA